MGVGITLRYVERPVENSAEIPALFWCYKPLLEVFSWPGLAYVRRDWKNPEFAIGGKGAVESMNL